MARNQEEALAAAQEVIDALDRNIESLRSALDDHQQQLAEVRFRLGQDDDGGAQA